VKTSNAIAAWNKADVIFLLDALKRGVAEPYLARFLGRSEDEVRDKLKVLRGQAPRKKSLLRHSQKALP
jgi:hypothetical protein